MVPSAITVLLFALLVFGFIHTSAIKQFFLKKFYFNYDILTVGDIFRPTLARSNDLRDLGPIPAHLPGR